MTPLTTIQKEQFRRVRALFRYSGFSRLKLPKKSQFTYGPSTCDVDDIFLHENVIVFLEYTTTNSGLSKHLKAKSPLYFSILEDPTAFIEFLQTKFPALKDEIEKQIYTLEQYQFSIVYSSYHPLDNSTKDEVPGIIYLDYNVVRYFESVARTMRFSARFEILEFLGVTWDKYASSIVTPNAGAPTYYRGSLLPDAHSNFGKDFKVVSFYADPEALLRRSYVLRRDGWRAGATLYQRMISGKKIEKIRRYLKETGRVFINNIISTLPSGTTLVNDDDSPADPKKLTTTSPARIKIPDEFGCVGVIDGQHRLFAYREGGSFESDIAKLRKRQNLLITGIIFPPGMADEAKRRFEANIFKEINNNQTPVKSTLTQEIEVLLKPYSAVGIAKRVMDKVNAQGPLAGQFEKFFYDEEKVKTSSVVSFELSHLVKIEGIDSLFSIWPEPIKLDLKSENNDALLDTYISFCASAVSEFLGAVKQNIPSERWTADRKVEKYFLNTTNINGCLRCFRRIVRSGAIGSHQSYSSALTGLGSFDFSQYKSSQYNSLGDKIFEEFF